MTVELSKAEARRLSLFDAFFVETAAHTNLVARSTLPDRAERHYEDSHQVWPLVPEEARSLLDIGSGAGFPGLLLANLALDRRPALRATLCDSVGKKARFLSAAIETMGLGNAEATERRAEALGRRFDVITARAVTALPALLDLAVPLLAPGGTMIFPKGARADEELEQAKASWRLTAKRVKSHTDPQASLLVLTDPERRP